MSELIGLPEDAREVAAAIESARTPNGGFTKAQLAAWGVTWPPPAGWKARLVSEARERG